MKVKLMEKKSIIKKYISKMIGKKGNYILEATITFPIFIISLLAMISIVGIIGNLEKSTFQVSDICQLSSIRRYFIDSEPLLPIEVAEKIQEENGLINKARVYNYKERVTEEDIKNLVSFEILLEFDRIQVEGHISFRAFVGSTRNSVGANRSEFEKMEKYEEVVIFHSYGEKYHRENCVYVQRENATSNRSIVDINNAKNKGYTPCEKCMK